MRWLMLEGWALQYTHGREGGCDSVALCGTEVMLWAMSSGDGSARFCHASDRAAKLSMPAAPASSAEK